MQARIRVARVLSKSTIEAKMTVLNIAHRGGAALWPENVLPSFEKAIEMGADGIEFDLQCAADGKIYIYHDDTVRPAHWPDDAYVSRLFRDLTPEEIAHLQVGLKGKSHDTNLACDFPDARVPLFSDLLTIIDNKASDHFRLYAELKTDMVDAKNAETLSAAYSSLIGRRRDRARIWTVSFDWRCIAFVRQSLAECRHAYTTLPFAETDPTAGKASDNAQTKAIRRASTQGAPWWGEHDWRQAPGENHGEKILNAIAMAQGEGWFAYWRDITDDRMRQAQSLGLSVSAWTVNETVEMERLARMGVDVIITDRPDLFPARPFSAQAS